MKRVFNRLDSAKNYAGTVFVLTSDGSGGTDVTNLTDELAEEKARYAVLAAAARRSRRSHLVPDFINTVTYFVRDGHESVKAGLSLGVRSCRGGVLLTSY